MTGVIKGERYFYIGKVAKCVNCGKEVYVDIINDYNLKKLYDEYRKKNDIISLDTILEIPKKYIIGKRPLSLLLGWGELTFTRYFNGDIPTKQYSKILQKIYDDPKYYETILEENKTKLKKASYDKSRNAVNELLSMDYPKSKLDLAIEYLLNQCEDITPLALQKGLYYVQGFYYAFFNEFMFWQDCQAWVYGPVYKEIYYRYRDYKFDSIKVDNDFDDAVFTSLEKAILESVSKHICCYSGKVLERFTHLESPWLLAREGLLETEPSNRIIKKEDISSYFSMIKEKYNMHGPDDIKMYAQAMFKKI